jgi:hypothetical protein
MDTVDQAMTAERLAAIEAGTASSADLRELLAETVRARADSDAQHEDALYWCESYRLAKGLSDDEIGAIIATRDAFRGHPMPCQFPCEECLCDND